VTARTTATVHEPRRSAGTKPEITITRGRPGMTSMTLENRENASSVTPPA
jgi:hypothetical protein